MRFGRKIPASILIAPFPRRHPVVTTAAVVLALWALVDAGHRSDRQRFHDREFAVVHVVDGDTVDILAADGANAHTRIRLWGVDTPEVEGSPAGAMYFGAQASEFTKRVLAGGRARVVLNPARTRDIYGRLLAYVYLPGSDGRMLNEMLIESGHAYADWRFDHPYRQAFEAKERAARAGRMGLWAAVADEQWPEWRRRMEAARSRK